MLIDGKKIREEIKEELKQQFTTIGRVVLAVVWVGNDPVTAKFVAQKKKLAVAIGVELRLLEFRESISEEDLVDEMNKLVNDQGVRGIIVQLPLPSQINSTKILSLIPSVKDVDALGFEPKVLSPVTQAVAEIIARYHINLLTNNFVILGKGQLVGRPVAIWLAQEMAKVEVIDKSTKDIKTITQKADVIICGAGEPGILTPDMIKDGVIIIDAGTSESAGKITGDALSACAEKSALFTPVPGGVGPIALVCLFKNLWKLSH
ncbi:MAG: bifunctional 5,10-methylenetetrahydrofolate dehydrogenase/5,10-methenyltetrahydrofolate cyclohydrolase [Patescibacteria group bacterium]|mgnify:CR=1 FL=1